MTFKVLNNKSYHTTISCLSRWSTKSLGQFWCNPALHLGLSCAGPCLRCVGTRCRHMQKDGILSHLPGTTFCPIILRNFLRGHFLSPMDAPAFRLQECVAVSAFASRFLTTAVFPKYVLVMFVCRQAVGCSGMLTIT